MKKSVLLIIGLVFLLSCSKERTFHLRVRNAVTGVPYAGLNYYVLEEREVNNGTDYTTVAIVKIRMNMQEWIRPLNQF